MLKELAVPMLIVCKPVVVISWQFGRLPQYDEMGHRHALWQGRQHIWELQKSNHSSDTVVWGAQIGSGQPTMGCMHNILGSYIPSIDSDKHNPLVLQVVGIPSESRWHVSSMLILVHPKSARYLEWRGNQWKNHTCFRDSWLVTSSSSGIKVSRSGSSINMGWIGW